MEIYRIRGGEALNGTVDISGAKNAALPILAATILTDETITLENVPKVNDTIIMVETLENLGAKVRYIDDNTLEMAGLMTKMFSTNSTPKPLPAPTEED